MTAKLLSGDSKLFWSLWNSHFHSSSVNSTCISGVANDNNFVQSFMQTFSQNCFRSAISFLLKDHFMSLHDKYVIDSGYHEYVEFTVNHVNKAILDLKKSKAEDAATLTVIFADHILFELLCRLSNACCKYGFVPNQFVLSLVVPVIKNNSAKTDVFENYRTISLVHIFSKVLDFVSHRGCTAILNLKSYSTVLLMVANARKHCLPCRLTVVDYYTTRGNPIYMAALDASKAYDRANHYGLFCKLMKLGLSLYLLNAVINLNLKLKRQVRWNGRLPDIFNIRSGTRQGGINST